MKHLPENMTWNVFKNTTSQIGGRMFLTLARFGIAVLIARTCGVGRLGEYSLILTLLLIAEWIVDFGLLDIVVRTMCEHPERQPALANTFAVAKIVQTGLAVLFLVGALAVMQYPPHIVRAGLVGAVSVMAYGGIQVFRASFRVRMTMERDVVAEVVSVLVMIPLVWAACMQRASASVLVACYSTSRVVFLASAIALRHRDWHISLKKAAPAEFPGLFLAALPIGLSLLLVSFDDAIGVILLSKVSSAEQVGELAGAMRLVAPVTIVVQSIAVSVFPLLAFHWRRNKEDFRRAQQNALDLSLLCGGGMLCMYQGGAEFFMGLLGAHTPTAPIVLRLVAVAISARMIGGIMGPMIIIAGRQKHGLWMASLGLGTQTALLIWLLPRYGVVGAAAAYTLGACVTGLITSIPVTQRLVGQRMNWMVAAKTVVAVIAASGVTRLICPGGSVIGAVCGGFLFLAASIAVGALSLTRLRELLRTVAGRLRKTPGAVQESSPQPIEAATCVGASGAEPAVITPTSGDGAG